MNKSKKINNKQKSKPKLNIGEAMTFMCNSMDQLNKNLESDIEAKKLHDQEKFDLAVLLFKLFVSVYKSKLNDNEINFVLSIIPKCQNSNIETKDLLNELSGLKLKSNSRNNTTTPKVEELNSNSNSNSIRTAPRVSPNTNSPASASVNSTASANSPASANTSGGSRKKKIKKSKKNQKGGVNNSVLNVTYKNLNQYRLNKLSDQCKKCLEPEFLFGNIDENGDEVEGFSTNNSKREKQSKKNKKYCDDNCSISKVSNSWLRSNSIKPFKTQEMQKLFIDENSEMIDTYVELMTSVVWFKQLKSINSEVKSKIELMRLIELRKAINEQSKQLLNNPDFKYVLPNQEELNINEMIQKYLVNEHTKLEDNVRSKVQVMIKSTNTFKTEIEPELKVQAMKDIYKLDDKLVSVKNMLYIEGFTFLLGFMNQQQGLINKALPANVNNQGIETPSLNYQYFEIGTNVLSYMLFMFQAIYLMKTNISSNQIISNLQYLLLILLIVGPFMPGIISFFYQFDTFTPVMKPMFLTSNDLLSASGTNATYFGPEYGISQYRLGAIDFSDQIQYGVVELGNIVTNQTSSLMGFMSNMIGSGYNKKFSKKRKNNRKNKYNKSKKNNMKGGAGNGTGSWGEYFGSGAKKAAEWVGTKATSAATGYMFYYPIMVFVTFLFIANQLSEFLIPNYSLILMALGTLIMINKVSEKNVINRDIQRNIIEKRKQIEKEAFKAMESIDIKVGKPPGGSGGLDQQEKIAEQMAKAINQVANRVDAALQRKATLEGAEKQAAAFLQGAEKQATATTNATACAAFLRGANVRAAATKNATATEPNVTDSINTSDLPDVPTHIPGSLKMENLKARLNELIGKPSEKSSGKAKNELVLASS